MPKPPPYPSLREARTRGGDAGVLALVRWVAAEHPPGRSTLSAAAIALGADAKDSDAVRSLAGALRKAAAHVGAPLPEYPRGTPVGHPSHAERRATAEAAAAKTKRAKARKGAE